MPQSADPLRSAPLWRVALAALIPALVLAIGIAAAWALVGTYIAGLAVLIGLACGWSVQRFAPGTWWPDRLAAATATALGILLALLLLPGLVAERGHGLTNPLNALTWNRFISFQVYYLHWHDVVYPIAVACAWLLAVPKAKKAKQAPAEPTPIPPPAAGDR